MSVTLDYASANLPRIPQRQKGICAATLAVASAFAIIMWTTELAQAAVPIGWCDTGRAMAQFNLVYFVPISFVFPGGAWLAAHQANYTILICRCSVWASAAAWLTAVIFSIG
jgi:hypothetical protein